MSRASPRVSAIILSYNCSAFIADALRSVLAQDFEPLEIVVSDDASEDDTFAIVQREVDRYAGPHRIELYRRPGTSGSKSAHLNEVFGKTAGDVLVFFDGDDISETSRVGKIVEVFCRNPTVQALYSAYSLIDETGRPLGRRRVSRPSPQTNSKAWFARVDAHAAGATLAVRREVIDRFAELDPNVSEDVVLPFRASLLGEVRYIEEPLVRARRRTGSLTQNFARFDSLENYRSRTLLGIEQARRNYESRLADLRTAATLMPERNEEVDGLGAVASASLADAESSAGLVSQSFRTRLRTLFQLWRSGVYRADLPQHFCLVFVPSAYLRYKRRMLGRVASASPASPLERIQTPSSDSGR